MANKPRRVALVVCLVLSSFSTNLRACGNGSPTVDIGPFTFTLQQLDKAYMTVLIIKTTADLTGTVLTGGTGVAPFFAPNVGLVYGAALAVKNPQLLPITMQAGLAPNPQYNFTQQLAVDLVNIALELDK